MGAPAGRWCGSRAATRSCSAAAARRPRRCVRPGSRSRSCPGVTAGVAAPAYAGIPVTHRDAASAVAFVTGHEDPTKPESALDWEALAAFPGTLVVYMGVRRLPAIAAAADRRRAASADEPAAVIERGTLPAQRVVTRHAGHDRRGRAPRRGCGRRRWRVFGAVAALRERLAWFEARPLRGVTVAVTRARAQASGLAATLRGLGAEVVEAPAIRIVPLDGPLADVSPLRPGLPDQPERSAAAVRAAGSLRGAMRVRSGRRAGGRDRPGHGGGAARARRDRRRRAGAVRGRGSRRGAGRRARDASAGGARGRGARRAARRAARARRRGRRARAVRDGGRAADRGRSSRRWRRRLRDVHLVLDRRVLLVAAGCATRRPGSSASAR